MNNPNNNVPPYIQPLAGNAPQPHPLRGWHITYSIIGALVILVFAMVGAVFGYIVQFSSPDSVNGLLGIFAMYYGFIAVALLSTLALVLLPFFLVARKKAGVLPVDTRNKQVRPGVVIATIVTIVVVAFLVFVASIIWTIMSM